jgi:hypothetical protein
MTAKAQRPTVCEHQVNMAISFGIGPFGDRTLVRRRPALGAPALVFSFVAEGGHGRFDTSLIFPLGFVDFFVTILLMRHAPFGKEDFDLFI